MPAVKESLLAQPLVSKAVSAMESLDIIDIRGDQVEYNLKGEFDNMFNPADGPRKIPTLLLYDEKGLQLFEDVSLSFRLCAPHVSLRA